MIKNRAQSRFTFEVLEELLDLMGEITSMDVDYNRRIVQFHIVSEDFDEVPEGLEAPCVAKSVEQ